MESGTRVEVTWRDSFASCGWFDNFDEMQTTEVKTIGYYIAENKTDIRLCRGISENGQYEGPFLLPKAAAISIMSLHLPFGG